MVTMRAMAEELMGNGDCNLSNLVLPEGPTFQEKLGIKVGVEEDNYIRKEKGGGRK